MQSAQEAGLKHNDDFNGENQLGVGFYQVTQFNGERGSTASTYLRPRCDAAAISICALTPRCRASSGREPCRRRDLRARRCRENRVRQSRCDHVGRRAGDAEAVDAIGHRPRRPSATDGYSVVKDLPGVGSNFQDHLEVSIYLKTRDPISLLGQDTRPCCSEALPLVEAVSQRPADQQRGGERRLRRSGWRWPRRIAIPRVAVLVGDADRAPLPGHGLSINPCFIRPKSRGTVRLRSNKTDDPIVFNSNSLAEEADVRALSKD